MQTNVILKYTFLQVCATKILHGFPFCSIHAAYPSSVGPQRLWLADLPHKMPLLAASHTVKPVYVQVCGHAHHVVQLFVNAWFVRPIHTPAPLWVRLQNGRQLTVRLEMWPNFLKPTGHVMHQQSNIQQLYVLPTLYLCVLYLSENKQRLVPLTA